MFTITKYDAKIGIRCQGYPSEFMVTAEQMNDLLIEAVARMNSTELFDFITLLAYKWPTLSDQICQNLSSTLMDKEHENYGGTD